LGVNDIGRQLTASGARTVLIDGRSGAGKTTLAAHLCDAWPGSTVVHLDDIYPGWNGLRAATEHIRSALLLPRSAGRVGRWQRWDWLGEVPAEWHVVPADLPLIIEGAGALTAINRALTDFGIWVDCADTVRKARALDRDGGMYEPHWERWAAQEDEHIARNHPRSIADVIVAGD